MGIRGKDGGQSGWAGDAFCFSFALSNRTYHRQAAVGNLLGALHELRLLRQPAHGADRVPERDGAKKGGDFARGAPAPGSRREGGEVVVRNKITRLHGAEERKPCVCVSLCESV